MDNFHRKCHCNTLHVPENDQHDHSSKWWYSKLLDFGSEGWLHFMLHHFILWRKWYIHNWLLIIIHHRNHISLLHSKPASPYMCKGISASFYVSTDVTPIVYAPCWITELDYELNQHSLTISHQVIQSYLVTFMN